MKKQTTISTAIFILCVWILFGCKSNEPIQTCVSIDSTYSNGNRLTGITCDGKKIGIWCKFTGSQIDTLFHYENDTLRRLELVFNGVAFEAVEYTNKSSRRIILSEGFFKWKNSLNIGKVSVDNGIVIFNNNCASCHNYKVLGSVLEKWASQKLHIIAKVDSIFFQMTSCKYDFNTINAHHGIFKYMSEEAVKSIDSFIIELPIL
jgi:hypothetical protein